MVIRLFILMASLVSFVVAANAQQIYKWKDQKGQWHFSNAPSSAKKTEKVKGFKGGIQTTGPSSKDPSSGTDKKIETTISGKFQDPMSAPSQKLAINRWFFMFSNKKILRVFDTIDACEQFKSLLVSRRGSEPEEKGEAESFDFYKEGRCVSSGAMKPSNREADGKIISMQLVPDPARVAHYVLSGTIMNRGQSTDNNVFVHYQIRRVGEMKVGKGKVLAKPKNIPGGGVAEYRGLIAGIPAIDGRNVRTEVHWSKE